jgi:hypothetical protein
VLLVVGVYGASSCDEVIASIFEMKDSMFNMRHVLGLVTADVYE